MVHIEHTSLEEVVRQPKKEGLFTKLGGAQFVAGQFFTILATIIGVYLAGYVGFQRTLEYDRYVKAQQQADLLSSTRAELQQNIERLRKFNELLPAEVGTPVDEKDWPRLRLFVWQAVGRSPSAFDVPPQILTPLQSFYEDLNDMLASAEARHDFRFLTTSNVYSRTTFKKKFEERLDFAEKTIIGALDKMAEDSASLLKKYSN